MRMNVTKIKFQASIICRNPANVNLVDAPYGQTKFHPLVKGIWALLTKAYAEPCQAPEMKIFSASYYFHKKLHLRCFKRFWIRLWQVSDRIDRFCIDKTVNVIIKKNSYILHILCSLEYHHMQEVRKWIPNFKTRTGKLISRKIEKRAFCHTLKYISHTVLSPRSLLLKF